MAVPKGKVSKQRRNKRRSSVWKLATPGLVAGTKAAEMEQVPGPVKEERAARASAVAAELHRAYLQGCVGQTYPVLFEQRKDGCAAGHAPNYMPVEVQTQEDYHNTVRHVKITGVVNDILMGEVT